MIGGNLNPIVRSSKCIRIYKSYLNKKEEAIKLLPSAYKSIDKACKTGVIKKNNAARKKSRITKLINR